jgi:hypothetical protein
MKFDCKQFYLRYGPEREQQLPAGCREKAGVRVSFAQSILQFPAERLQQDVADIDVWY